MFSYPAIVVVAAIALRREPPSRRRLGAVAIATAGVVLTLAGGATGAIDPVGVALALAAAAIYATYVLSADALGGRMHPLTFAALICTGAAIAFAAAGTTPRLDPPRRAALAGVAVDQRDRRSARPPSA